MSAKALFLKKLEALQSSPRSFESKSQKDIATFCQRIGQLQEEMESWLEGSGIRVESTSVSLIDFLVDYRAFSVPGILLRYEDREIKFTPLFLYGQGVTGCVEVSLGAEGKVTPMCRLFMRSSRSTNWTCTQSGTLSEPERAFDEEVFFAMIAGLLP